jgi:hypothetical protein
MHLCVCVDRRTNSALRPGSLTRRIQFRSQRGLTVDVEWRFLGAAYDPRGTIKHIIHNTSYLKGLCFWLGIFVVFYTFGTSYFVLQEDCIVHEDLYVMFSMLKFQHVLKGLTYEIIFRLACNICTYVAKLHFMLSQWVHWLFIQYTGQFWLSLMIMMIVTTIIIFFFICLAWGYLPVAPGKSTNNINWKGCSYLSHDVKNKPTQIVFFEILTVEYKGTTLSRNSVNQSHSDGGRGGYHNYIAVQT